MKLQFVTIQMETIEQYFYVALFFSVFCKIDVFFLFPILNFGTLQNERVIDELKDA